MTIWLVWICPLEIQWITAMTMLDSEHKRLPQPPNDHSTHSTASTDTMLLLPVSTPLAITLWP
ncbi:hypothetical protein BDV26DRAFT_275743 [Aspergillus bertholletiae]|uniref:Uncharacterized protein n=1 Tax=Aspergillus bertholletiae TaxID=1226010 RepID=A0A5N7AP40_9EURO|nr:hypothetical protein BDV26DRAFT_275743 [Aspergillus bertholletiae]